MEEKNSPHAEEKSWNQQLLEWFTTSEYTKTGAAEKIGIPRSTFHGYLTGRPSKIDSMDLARRKSLYEVTDLDVFKISEEESAKLENKTLKKEEKNIRRKSSSIFSTLQALETHIGHLKRTLTYKGAESLLSGGETSSKERIRIVETAVDLLVEQMDYFRSASQNERNDLIAYLEDLGEVERWGYVSNLFNQLHKPSGAPDTFLRSMSAPQKNKWGKN